LWATPGTYPSVEHLKKFHLDRLLPCLQTLYYSEKAFQEQILWLIPKNLELTVVKSFIAQIYLEVIKFLIGFKGT
jgi:hypothetical protein